MHRVYTVCRPSIQRPLLPPGPMTIEVHVPKVKANHIFTLVLDRALSAWNFALQFFQGRFRQIRKFILDACSGTHDGSTAIAERLTARNSHTVNKENLNKKQAEGLFPADRTTTTHVLLILVEL